jgi:hypothetical protein
MAAIDVPRPPARGPVPPPLDRLATWSALSGIPVGELARIWKLAAVDGSSSVVVRERVEAALKGDVVKFGSRLPRPRIY